jgi:acetoin utilization protein AcuB
VPATEYFVRDIMTYEVVTVEPTALLLDAALTLRAGSIRHLLVVEDDLLVGVLSDRDIQRCAPSRLMPVSEEDYNAVFADTTVTRVMTRNPETVSSNTPLAAAITTMQQSRFGCLPVVDDDKLVGLLTRSDLVDALQRVLLGKPIAKAGEGI